uniref:Uncharacterized protein n=1 Tax=Caenorhabditis japonica TaxID=281687 RepID=A0A8R1HT37_CAEJA
MSSWFSYFGFNKGSPLEEVKEESEENAQVPENIVPKSAEENLAEAMNSLSPEQQNIIQDVLRRAEHSRKEAKIVVDAEMMRSRYQHRESVEDSEDIDHRYSLVQMDSIPENMITNEMEERNMQHQENSTKPVDRDQKSKHSPNQKRASITEVTTASLRNRFQKMKSHLTSWFNSLDYDGEYTFDITGKREKSENLGELTMQYIDALSQAIMISSHIQYSHHLLSSDPSFHLMCTRFCESIFSLAFDDLTYQLLDEKVRETLNAYCGQIAEEALQAAFLSLVSKTLPNSEQVKQVVNQASQMHKSRSFESAQELDQFLSRMEDSDYDRNSSRKSSPYMYEVLEPSQSVSTSSSNEMHSQNSYDSEISYETPVLYVEEIFDVQDYHNYKLSRDSSLNSEEDGSNRTDKYQYDNLETAVLENQVQSKVNQIFFDQDDEKYKMLAGPLEKITEEQDEDETRTESSSVSIITYEDGGEPKMQMNVEQYIQTMIDRVSEIEKSNSRTMEISAPSVQLLDFVSLPTVDEPVALLKQLSEHEYDQFDQEGLYEKTFPVMKPAEEIMAETTVKPVGPERPELTQEEIDHIAWIQQIAEQSSFETAGPPSQPPVHARLPTVDKPVAIQKQLTEHDEDRSSETSGADFETSFDHDGSYEKTSPLLEPIEETIAEPIAEATVKPKEPELTQEEIDHITWIQQIAEQSSFETTGPPSRPPVPARLPTVDEPVAIQKQLTEHDEDRSSATSGADFETSFDHDGLYESTSPLLEPVEETIAEAIVKPEKPELTKEEIDHITWIQQIAEQSSFETTGPPSRPPVPARLPTVDEPVAIQKQLTEHDEDRSSATSGADFETPFDHDGLYESTSPLLEPVEETIAGPIAEATVKPEKPELTQEEIDHIAWIQQIAKQASFETAGPPSRPPVPARLPTVDEPVAIQKQFTEHDDDRSSATSGADFETSFDHDGLYENTSPLLEPVEGTIAESIAEATVKPEKPELTQEKIDHITWIQQIAEQSSFETTGPPSRPPVPARLPTVDEPVAIQKQLTEHDEDRSSATSGADFETSFDHDGLYENTSPLLEPVEGTIAESIAEATVKPEKPELTQEEIDHIAWIQQIAKQASFETAGPPSRPPVPARLPTVDEPVAIQKQLTEHDEDRSSATSGADFETSFDHDGLYENTSPLLEPVEGTIAEPIVKPEKPEMTKEEIDHIAWIQQIAEQSSFETAGPTSRLPSMMKTGPVRHQVQILETSFDHDGLYENTSPLLEPVEGTIAESIAEATVKPEKPELTQEKIDHITWIQQIAEQSSFETTGPPSRPPVPARLPTVDEPVAIQKQLTEHDEDRSSATSGADFETSFDHDGLYENTSPLLEPVEGTIAEPIVKPEKPEMTKEEIDHIAWIQQIAEQSSFETAGPTSRLPVPARLPTVDEPVAIQKQLTEHDEDRSSATSGADFETSFDHDGSYEKTSPLLEPIEETIAEPIVKPEKPELTKEEIDHITWIQQIAEQTSFEKVGPPSRPPVPARLPTVDEPVAIQKQLTEHDEDRSSATSGADFETSFDHDGLYEKTSPLLEPVEETIAKPIVKPEKPELTQEEIDHIAWIQQIAEQSSFEKVGPPSRPPVPARLPTVDEPVAIQKQLTEHDEDRSSATSGADFETSFDHDGLYERTSPLLEPVEETITEPIVKPEKPELTQEEIDHITWTQQIAEQSSFEAAEPPTRPPVPARLPTVDEPVAIQKQLTEHDEDRSSATSGADFETSFDHDGLYERTSPLLEPVEETITEPIVKPEKPELTQEEIDHIAWIQQIAEQSSFETTGLPSRPPVPARLPTVDEPVAIQKQLT